MSPITRFFIKRHIERNLEKRSMMKDIKIFFLAVGVIMIWRGVWNLLDHYLFPHHWVLSSILSIIFGILILFLNDNDLSELAGDE